MCKYSRKIGICSLLILVFFSFAFCEESMTITTYYPSPYGVYKTLRLYPNTAYASGDSCSNAGEIFYNATDYQILACEGNPSTWKPINVVSGGLYGWCVVNISTCMEPAVSPAYCVSGTGCLCLSGYTPKMTGASGNNFYYTCIKD